MMKSMMGVLMLMIIINSVRNTVHNAAVVCDVEPCNVNRTIVYEYLQNNFFSQSTRLMTATTIINITNAASTAATEDSLL